MERGAWLAERRAAVVADYDVQAATFDDDPYPNGAQVRWVERLVAACPADGVVLDAPCGTGRYFSIVTASGRLVVGADQSARMLEQARAVDGAIEIHHVGLQELPFADRFDAAMTIDAMENVAPEDWPVVVANVHRALHAGAQWYLTVEEQDRSKIERTYESLRSSGLPVVLGEVVGDKVAGYHFYPERDRVIEWVESGGFVVVDEDVTQYDGWAYRHLLLGRREG